MSDSLALRLPDAIRTSEDLPSPPGVVVEVLRLSKDERAGLDEFARVISGDPALAAKLIKLSNSSLFSVGHDVTTLERACVLLGLKTVQLMALSFSMMETAGASEPEGGFAFEEYWTRCLCAAVAGRAFSAQLGWNLDDEAFLCGLLSQIGQLAILQSMPDAYRSVLDRTPQGWPTRETERDVLGFDRSEVGAALLQDWGLPTPVCLSIAFSHRSEELPSDAPDDVRRLTLLMRAAELTANVLLDESKHEPLVALRDVATSAGLGEEDLDALLDGLDEELLAMAAVLDLELEPSISRAEIMDDARKQAMRISLGAAADLHQAERRADHLALENRALAQKASKDELTGIPNRAGFDEILADEIAALKDGSRPGPLGLLMLDADHFKRFNDSYGHRAGDEVLRTLGRVLMEATRETDVPARYGGEEFAVIAPATSPEGLETLAERLRQTIEAESVVHGGAQLRVTVSIGGASLADAGSQDATGLLVETADQSLYEAKHAGRNRCMVAAEPIGAAVN